MLPGVSAFDCLIADLGIDPGDSCQMYEATRFLLHHSRGFDPSAALILWQVGSVGHPEYQLEYSLEGYKVLAGFLADQCGADHEVILYEAAVFGLCDPRVVRTPLGELAQRKPSSSSTLVVPAGRVPRRNQAMARQLGLVGPTSGRPTQQRPVTVRRTRGGRTP
jgi:hypothetical protein